MTHDEIFAKLTEYLVEVFEVPPEKITRDARLFEDLDLDSIDAVDLIVKVQELTGKKIKPDRFKSVRTVGDIVDQVHELIAS
jgi:acyl carrier protein